MPKRRYPSRVNMNRTHNPVIAINRNERSVISIFGDRINRNTRKTSRRDSSLLEVYCTCRAGNYSRTMGRTILSINSISSSVSAYLNTACRLSKVRKSLPLEQTNRRYETYSECSSSKEPRSGKSRCHIGDHILTLLSAIARTHD